MTTQNTKRYMMPLFAFFIMLAGARAAETVTDCLWVKEYPYGTKFQDVQYSKADKFVVALEQGNFIFLNAETGQEMGRVQNRQHPYPLEDRKFGGNLEFVNNDKEFYIQSLDRKTIECYSTSDFTKLYDLGQVEDMIYEFSVSPDEKYLVASVGSKGMKLWDLSTKAIVATYTQPTYTNDLEGSVKDPMFTPDGKAIVANYYRKMQYPDYPVVMNRNIQYNLQLDSTRIFDFQTRFVWSKSGNYVATMTLETDGVNFVITDVATKKEVSKFLIRSGAIVDFFFSNDEQYMIAAYTIPENICRVYRIADGENTINYQTGSANGAALSNSGNDLAFVTANVAYKYRFSSSSTVQSSMNHEFSITPNPIVDSASFSFNLSDGGIANISISDAQGAIAKQITTEYLAPGVQNLQLPLNDLANGVYYISITCGADTFTSQFVINRQGNTVCTMIFVICMIEDEQDKNSILIFKHINHINQINHSSDE